MRPPSPIRRSREEDTEDARRQLECTRKALKALDLPMPDTFMGRKTQEPFPRDDDE
jgi:hypothetical protein